MLKKVMIMVKIGFISTNKVLAQSLLAAIDARSELGFELFVLLNPSQAILDIEVLKINTAVIDILDGTIIETETALSFCKKLRKANPDCRLLLLLSQDDKIGKKMVINAIRNCIADDFVFYDTSLEYLFAKLSAF